MYNRKKTQVNKTIILEKYKSKLNFKDFKQVTKPLIVRISSPSIIINIIPLCSIRWQPSSQHLHTICFEKLYLEAWSCGTLCCNFEIGSIILLENKVSVQQEWQFQSNSDIFLFYNQHYYAKDQLKQYMLALYYATHTDIYIYIYIYIVSVVVVILILVLVVLVTNGVSFCDITSLNNL